MPGRSHQAAVLVAVLAAGCARIATRGPHAVDDFFPLSPASTWEYVVSRRGGADTFRFVATVRPDAFVRADGRTCRIVDERYTDVSAGERFPVVYCSDGGFLHRVLSLEYRGETLEDTGLKSGELRFLPTDLAQVRQWQGWTNAYRLPDGSGFQVQQFHEVRPELERVDVPAGHFARCIRVETMAAHFATGPDGSPVGPRFVFYYSDWYAPGVGLVKTEQRSASSEVVATIDLLQYEIARDAATP